MINSIMVKNFKGIKNTDRIEIKPITVLVGNNSSGKTSFIQAIMVLKQTLESEEIGTGLQLNGPYFELGSFRDLVFGHDINKRIIYEFESDISTTNDYFDKLLPGGGREKRSGVRLIFEMKYLQKSRLILVEKFRIEYDGKGVIEIKQPRRGVYELSSDVYPDIKLIKKAVTPYKFFFYLSYSKLRKIEQKNPELRECSNLGFIINELLIDNFDNLYLQGPIRDPARRFYTLSGITGTYRFPRGEKSQEILVQNLLKRRKRKESKVVEKARYWLEKFDMLSSLGYEITHNILFNLKGIDPLTNITVSLPDIGFGVSQILPIIINGYNLDENSLFFVEQPEIHLHPRLQAEVADLLIDIAHDNKKVVVETHSEHLIMRLLKRIAEGKEITNKDVAIYNFNRTKDGIKIQEVELTEDGQYDNWPDNFFDIGYREAAEWVKTVLEKKRGKK